MTFSHRVALAFLLVGMLSIPRAWAQNAPTAPAVMPPAVKSAAVIGPAEDVQIKKFVGEQVLRLGDPDATQIPRAREALIGEAGGAGVSAAYQAKYAEVLSAEVIKFLQTNKEPRPRLNAAIVVAKVADIVKNTKLEKAVLALLEKAQTEPMKLWGMRAAKTVLPELVKVKGEKPLVEAVLATVKFFPANGEVAQDAYDALNPRNVAPKDVPLIVDPLLELAAWRLTIYEKGLPDAPNALVPDLPLADTTPFENIFNAGVWPNIDRSKGQHVRAVQLACNLLVLSARRGDNPQFQAHRDALRDSIRTTSGAVFVMASLQQEQAVADEARRINREIGQVGIKLVQVVEPLCPLLPKMKGFEEVKPLGPPTLAPQNQNPPAPPAQPAQPAAAGAGTAADQTANPRK